MRIFHDAPKFPPSRQQALCAAVGPIEELFASEQLTTAGHISIKGFPASHIDLGWLQDRVRAFWRMIRIPMGMC